MPITTDPELARRLNKLAVVLAHRSARRRARRHAAPAPADQAEAARVALGEEIARGIEDAKRDLDDLDADTARWAASVESLVARKAG